jgi:hypothetical protein
MLQQRIHSARPKRSTSSSTAATSLARQQVVVGAGQLRRGAGRCAVPGSARRWGVDAIAHALQQQRGHAQLLQAVAYVLRVSR